MKTSWLQGLDETRRTEVKQNFKESGVLRRRMIEILYKKIGESNSASRLKSNYEKPSWAYEQADARGYERAMSEMIELVSSPIEE
jgi:hypothetical protein